LGGLRRLGFGDKIVGGIRSQAPRGGTEEKTGYSRDNADRRKTQAILPYF
jgi:hypothetical protein